LELDLAMIELIEAHRAQLEELCRRHHVRRLELFGSAVDGTWDSGRSDLDFLVEFLPEATSRIFAGYFDLKDSLENLFGRKIDLVMPRAVRNPHLRMAIDRQRRILYGA
jgi:predicted nucleotidyltransferase